MKSLSIQSLSALGVAFLSVTLATGCGSTGNVVGKGPSKTDTRTVAEFTSVLADETADVIAMIGPLKPIQVTADENIVPIITTKVEGNTLIISTSKSYQTKNSVKVMIQAPNIDTITTRGSGDVTLKTTTVDTLTLSTTGSGDITATGNSKTVNLESTGSGDISAENLTGENVTATNGGAGNIDLRATKTLNASNDGSGNITYSGNPNVTQSNKGSGEINARK
jgi:Putative auto-transporter adhesin, head GIN domain